MKRILGLVMGASILAVPAVAQQPDHLKDPFAGGAAAPRIGSSLDGGLTSAINDDFNKALSAINASSANAAALRALGSTEALNVVRIGSLPNFDEEAVEQAVMQNRGSIDILRGTIAAEPALYERLQAEGVSMSNVVGAEVKGGLITIYVR